MSESWTESLIDPLATIAGGRSWRQVQECREGGWLLLAGDLDGEAAWYHANGRPPELQPLSPLDDSRIPAVRRAVTRWLHTGLSIEVLAWRVGRRAVFRIGGPSGRKICKIYRRDREVLQRWTVLEGATQEAWRTPRVLNWDAGLRCLTIENCPGISLNRKWLEGNGEPSDGSRIADLLDWIGSQSISTSFPRHGVEDEVQTLQKRLAEYERTLRDPSPNTIRLTHAVIKRLQEEPPGNELLCHRDLHDKQILLEGERGYLIDLDLAAVGPAALDVGNILAQLRLRALKGATLPWRQIAERIVGRAVPARGIERSLAVWTAATLMRLTLIYARRRRDDGLLEQLTDSTAAALDGRGEWSGIV